MDNRRMVSVVVTAYNYGMYVRGAIESVLSQTYKNLDILVIDDGSTDETRDVLARFVEEGRIRYLYQDNAGQARAKNRGIEEAWGEFVAFLDADDKWLPQKIEKQIKLFDDERVGVVCSKRKIMHADGRLFHNPPHTHLRRGYVLGPIFAGNFVPFSTSVVRKSCFDCVGVFDETLGMGIDYDLWIRMASRYHFDYVDEELAIYRFGHEQMSRNFKKRIDSNWSIIEKNMNDEIVISNLKDKYIKFAYGAIHCSEGDYNASEGNMFISLRSYINSLRYAPMRRETWVSLIKLFIMQKNNPNL